MSRRLYVFIFLMILWCISAKAQDFPMLHYTIEDGLPSNNIYHAYRDKKGWIWFGTDKGITRYNGEKFETFTTFNGLPDNEIFFFKEDFQDRLWLGTYNGELCYYKDGFFYTSKNSNFLKLPFKTPHIYNITLEFDSSITFNFFNTNILVSIKDEKTKIYDFSCIFNRPVHPIRNYIYYKRKISNDIFELIYQYETLYVDTLYNIVKGIKRKRSGPAVLIPSQDRYFFIINGNYLHEAGYDTEGDNYIYSEKFDTVCSLKKYLKKSIHTYYTDNINSFLGHNDGITINDSFGILKNNDVSSITQDNNKNYWISTLNKGIYSFSRDFLSMQLRNNSYQGIVKKSIYRKNIFFSTIQNDFYGIVNDHVYCYLENKKKYTSENMFPKEGTYLLDESNKHLFFFGKYNAYIHDFSKNKVRICKYYGGVDSSGVKEAFLIKNNIYIIGRSNIVRIDYNKITKSKKILYKNIYNNPAQRIYGTAIAPDSSIWLSLLTNMIKVKENYIDSLIGFNNNVLKYFIFFDSTIIGYTHDNRLIIYKNYCDLSIKDTIFSQNCIWNKICILNKYHLLLSTNGRYRLLSKSNGISKYSITTIENPYIPIQAEAICSDSLNCYFFKNGSITSVSIESLLAKPNPPKVILERLKTDKSNRLIRDTLVIPYTEALNLSISFSRIVEVGREISQQYSISKSNNDKWVDIDGEEINFINAGYGTYTIKLRAKTLSSDYCTPVKFTLIIARPYWATWWFISLLVIATVVLIGFVVKYRIHYMVRKNAKEHQKEMKFIKSEYKALNALMNPHFVFNTLNNVQGLVNRNDKLAANEYIRVFADLIRQNMHNLSKELISLQKEMDLVVNYLLLEKLRFKDLLNYKINIDENIDLSEIMIPPLLVQPLVENSIKHGILPLESVEGCVQINIYEQTGILYIEVRDNGVGMEKSREKSQNSLHESFGMDNIRKRIQQLSLILNKEIELHIKEEKEGDQRWTVVTISMPNS